MRLLARYISVVLLLLSASMVQARDLMHFDQYTTANGLPNNRISSACEDDYGNVWFTTWDGLCRWDGHKMMGFNKSYGDQSMGRVRNISLLENGMLYFLNDSREKFCFDPKQCALCPFPDTLIIRQLPVTKVSYEEDATGLRILRDGVVYHIPYAEGVREESQLHIFFEDSKGQIWFDLNNSLYRVWFEPSPFFHYKVWPQSPYMPFRATVRALNTSPNGTLLAASRNYQLFGLNDGIVQLPGNVYSMQTDAQGRLWLALRQKGLYVWTHKDGLQPAVEDFSAVGLTDLFSMMIQKDSSYLWAGTWGSGVRILDISGAQPTLKRTLYNDSLTSIHQIIQVQDDRVGLCTTHGLHIYSSSGNTLFTFVPDYDVLCAIQLPDQSVLFGTMGQGLFLVTSDGICRQNRQLNIKDRIISMYQTGNQIWMIADSRVYRYNLETEILDMMDEEDFGEPITFAESSVVLCQDSLLYLGASVGIVEINVNGVEAYLLERNKNRSETLMKRVLYVINVAVVILLIVAAVMWFTWRKAKKQIQSPFLFQLKPKSNTLSEEDAVFVQKLTEVLNQAIGQADIDMSFVAEQMQMTRNTLYSRCAEVLQSSPASMLQEMRMEYAERLIHEGISSVKDIALQSGFNDPKYFSKVFKNRYDMTPTQYVERYGKK